MNDLIKRLNQAQTEWLRTSIASEEKYEQACTVLAEIKEEIRLWQKESNALLDAEYGSK